MTTTTLSLPTTYLDLLARRALHFPPWELLVGPTQADVEDALSLAARPEADGLIPFARRVDDGAVASFMPSEVERGPEVLVSCPAGDRQQEIAILPGFQEWLRLALDEMTARLGVPTQPASEPPPDPHAQRDRNGETRKHLLRKLRAGLDMSFVRAAAGDVDLDAWEREEVSRRLREGGDAIYAEMMFVLTHQELPARQARALWGQVLRHRVGLSRALGRPVPLVVAAADLLEGSDEFPHRLTLCSEQDLLDAAQVALRDGLTGLFDQSTFKSHLRRELSRARRYGSALSVLMLDLDHFKRLNDTLGHQRGDRVLAQLGSLLRREVRDCDVTARYGGEEFGVILPHTPLVPARWLAERLRNQVGEVFADVGLTVSIGVASYPDHGRTGAELVRSADRALYRSKDTGRDRVTCAATSSCEGGAA